MSPDQTSNGESTPAVAHRIANWLLTGRSEPSSKFMAGVALNGAGYRSAWNDPTPHDAADLGRCVQLLQAVPEVRGAFAVIQARGPVWAIYIKHWEELTALWRQGDLNKTNERLRELRRNAECGARSAEQMGDESENLKSDHQPSSGEPPRAKNQQPFSASQPQLTGELL